MSCREVHFHKVDNCLIIYSQHTVPGVYRIRMYNLKTPSLKMSLVFVARHCCRHRISISHHQVHTHCYENSTVEQRYTYRVLQTIQMKLILLCVWAERAILGSAKTALKFKYEI